MPPLSERAATIIRPPVAACLATGEVAPDMAGKRVALFIPSLHGGGAERVMVSLANGLAAKGLDVDLVLARKAGVYLNDVSPEVSIVDLRVRRTLQTLFPLALYLRRERPATLVSAMNYVNVIASWALRISRVPTRLVMTEHANLSQLLSDANSGLAWCLPRLMRAAYIRADAIIAVSDGVAQDLAKTLGFAAKRIHTRHNPIDVDALAAKSTETLDHPWFAPNAPPVVLAAGRLSPEKDFPILIRAFALLRAQRPARLVILGEGGQRKALEGLIDDLDCKNDILLPGFQANPYTWMRRAGVFVLSSRWEGFGNVLVEAMACGVPVVSTACPSGPEEILENGRWGRLTPVGDAAALANAIGQTLADPHPPNVRVRAEDFSVDCTVQAYLPLLLPSAPAPLTR